jgi:hypothetical protein
VEEKINEVRRAITSAYCNMDYSEFCKRIERDEDDQWAKSYWIDFQNLKSAFDRFDNASLAKIIGQS